MSGIVPRRTIINPSTASKWYPICLGLCVSFPSHSRRVSRLRLFNVIIARKKKKTINIKFRVKNIYHKMQAIPFSWHLSVFVLCDFGELIFIFIIGVNYCNFREQVFSSFEWDFMTNVFSARKKLKKMWLKSFECS